MEDNDIIDTFLRDKMQKQLLKFAVCRQIFCSCGNVMDIRRAVLIETKNTTSVFCRTCGERFLGKLVEKYGNDAMEKAIAEKAIEITRGYKLPKGRKGTKNV